MRLMDTVTVVVAGGGRPLSPDARAALAAAHRVVGSPGLLRAVHGLVARNAVTDVVPDAVYEGFASGGETGHRWDPFADTGDVVVLAPPGRAALAVARSLRPVAVELRFLDDGVRDLHGREGGAGPQVGGPAPDPHEEGPAGGAGGAAAAATRRVRAAVDLTHLGPLSRAVAERVVLVTGDPRWAEDLVLDEAALARGLVALRAGRPIVVDTPVVAAAITTAETVCGLQEDAVERLAAVRGTTPAAEGLRVALRATGRGAVVVVGEDPAALRVVLAADADPALVVGLPAGWVDVVEAKAAVRGAGVPALTNRARTGGPVAAAAAVDALLRRAGTTTVGLPARERGADVDG